METITNINIPLHVPQGYRLDVLTQQLTDYAKRLIALKSAKRTVKKHYQHESLCGIFDSKATQDELIEEYLQDKYQL